ncbi:eCIS core domain-containing protein [Myxococcus sp. Y35]|uniref:eCIS core domain-containing protein n=1 Tax=Pseudomyxococcus flavus TaxID=3115648 RepID=UPI003CEC50BB
MQPKEAGGTVESRPSAIRREAHAGVKDANAPLPHFALLQQAFGRHDLSNIKARVGGEAALASDRMGAHAFTMGNRIAFRAPPDLRLAAHEAAHAVQQQAGVQLHDGVGHPGDPYERQADEAADAVVRGETAEPILNRTVGPSGPPVAETSPSEAPVQRFLAVNAHRLFEPPTAPSRMPRARGGGGSSAGGARTSAEARSSQDENSTESSSGAAGSALGAAAGPATDALSSGTSEPTSDTPAPPAASDTAQQCTGGSDNATCYTADIEEPETEPEQEPPEPEPTESQEAASSVSPDAEEQDICPIEEAISQQAPSPDEAAAPAQSTLESNASTPEAAASSSEAASTSDTSATQAPEATGAHGAATEEDAANEAASAPLDEAIATTEVQRWDAVATHGNASAALASAGAGTIALRGGAQFVPTPGATAQDDARRVAANARAGTFFRHAADRIEDAVLLTLDDVPARIGALAETYKSAISSSMEEQKAAISASVEQARIAATAQADGARQHVLSEHEATVATIHSETDSALASLQTAYDSSLMLVDEQESSTLDSVNSLYAQARIAHEALGPTVGDECIQLGEEYAEKYEDCKINKKDSFFAGYLTDRRAEAQMKAARETAKGYRKSLVDTATKQAGEVMKGRQRDRCGVIAAARRARETLDTQYEQLVSALESSRTQALSQAETTRDSMLASVDSAFITELDRLDRHEHDQRQSVNDTGYLQQVLIELAAFASAASIQNAVTGAIDTVVQALTSVRDLFATQSAPEGKHLERILGQAMGGLEGGLDGLVTQVEHGAAGALERVDGVGNQGLEAMLRLGQSSEEATAALVDSFTASMGALAAGATTSFGQQRDAFTTQTQQVASDGATGLETVATGFETTCATILTHVESALVDSADALEQSLRDSKAQLDCDIPTQAQEAASKEQPAWKGVLAVVLIIAIVIVVALVVGPAVIGAVGAAASALGAGTAAAATIGTIVGGAIVGAATSATIQVLNNWASGQRLLEGVDRAALMGAIGGVFGAGAGAIIQHTVKSVAIQFVANVAADAVLEVGTQLVTGEFSWHALGMSVLMSVVTGGFGEVPRIKRVQQRWMARGAGIVPGSGARTFRDSIAPRPPAESEASTTVSPRPEAEADVATTPRPEAEADVTTPRPEAEADSATTPRSEAEASTTPRTTAETDVATVSTPPRPEAEVASTATPRPEAQSEPSTTLPPKTETEPALSPESPVGTNPRANADAELDGRAAASSSTGTKPKDEPGNFEDIEINPDGRARQTVGWSGDINAPSASAPHLEFIKNGIDFMESVSKGMRSRLDELVHKVYPGDAAALAEFNTRMQEISNDPLMQRNLGDLRKDYLANKAEIERIEALQADLTHEYNRYKNARDWLLTSMESRSLKNEAKAAEVMSELRNALLGEATPHAAAIADAPAITQEGLDAIHAYGRTEAQVRADINEHYRMTGNAPPEGFFLTKGPRPEDNRAEYYHAARFINVGDQPSSTKMHHELSHRIEHIDPEISSASKSFVEARARRFVQPGQPIETKSLRDLTGIESYESYEFAYEGGFIDPYVGKVYNSPATEVVTMGLERFNSPTKMAQLYRQDPEHFFYVLGVVQRMRARAGLTMPTTSNTPGN